MSSPSNLFNISSAGLIGFDGVNTFNSNPITQYNVLVGSSSNTVTSVSPSDAGKVFTSNGLSSDPSFKTLSGTNLIWLGNASFSSGTLEITSLITSTYQHYFFHGQGLGGTGATYLRMLFSNDGGSSYFTSGYISGVTSIAWNNNTPSNTNSTTSALPYVTASANIMSFQLWLYFPTSDYPTWSGRASSSNTTQIIGGGYGTQVTVNALKLETDSTDYSGTISLYGLKTS